MHAEPGIRLLSVNVANKIAAGEVVERPASVAKELLENAFDARSSRIDVEVGAGGRKLVAVRDNGLGMNRDDALLAVERHATSKIRDVADIENIATLGFRGEALAAIASVSRFRLTTCVAGDDAGGTELTITGGRLQDVRDVGCPVGTSIEVRDLFFNVPARRKFLRSHTTELAHLRSAFMLQALAHPGVGMSLTVDGRETCRLPADSELEDRVRDLFGSDYPRRLRRVDHTVGDVRVWGYVGEPAFTRSDRHEQFIFVNGRAAGAPLLAHAVREGYRTLVGSDRHPCVFLYLETDPSFVDVNVHPTKKEVRFRHPSAVRDSVLAAIHKALQVRVGGTGAQPPPSEGPASPPLSVPDVLLRIDDLPAAPPFRYPRMPAVQATGDAPGRPAGVSSSEPPAGGAAGEAPWAWCRVLGQVGGLYVLLETDEGYVVMDPHAAHERVLFERFMAQFLGGALQVQNLLIPETAELSPQDALCVRKHLDLLKDMGIGLSEFGADTFVVDALPACFAGAAGQAMLVEMAHHLEEAGARRAQGRWREEAIAQAACKAAVRARDRLSLEEIEQLIVDLAGTDMPYTCPHGRPTLIFTSFKELNRKFARE